jgi:transketolase C-terminal domain/subunit
VASWPKSRLSATKYGVLGNTHSATEDISFLQTMSNNVVLALAGAVETWQPICEASMIDGPVCVRIGRGDVTFVYGENQEFESGRPTF